jgi:hypothetical protein
MRQNFTRIALDAATTRLMTTREETDPQRKKEILAALQGQEYPATSVQRGRVVLLDRMGLDRYPAPHNPSRALWTAGYDQVAAVQRKRALSMPAQRATVASVRPSNVESMSIPAPMPPARTDGRTDGAQYSQDRALLYLRALVRKEQTREQARAWMEGRGLTFQNSLFTQARGLEGRK